MPEEYEEEYEDEEDTEGSEEPGEDEMKIGTKKFIGETLKGIKKSKEPLNKIERIIHTYKSIFHGKAYLKINAQGLLETPAGIIEGTEGCTKKEHIRNIELELKRFHRFLIKQKNRKDNETLKRDDDPHCYDYGQNIHLDVNYRISARDCCEEKLNIQIIFEIAKNVYYDDGTMGSKTLVLQEKDLNPEELKNIINALNKTIKYQKKHSDPQPEITINKKHKAKQYLEIIKWRD